MFRFCSSLSPAHCARVWKILRSAREGREWEAFKLMMHFERVKLQPGRASVLQTDGCPYSIFLTEFHLMAIKKRERKKEMWVRSLFKKRERNWIEKIANVIMANKELMRHADESRWGARVARCKKSSSAPTGIYELLLFYYIVIYEGNWVERRERERKFLPQASPPCTGVSRLSNWYQVTLWSKKFSLTLCLQ